MKAEFHPVWKQVTPELAQELMAFWQANKAIVEAGAAANRALQAVCIARDEAGALCGVATAVVKVLPRLRQPMYYYRQFFAKGLREIKVIMRHALKNSLIPVVTIMAIQVASLLSGAVITEAIFGIPGVGRISVNAIQARDMPLLQGSVLFATALVILGNLVADILYSVLDPRIRHQMKGGVK